MPIHACTQPTPFATFAGARLCTLHYHAHTSNTHTHLWIHARIQHDAIRDRHRRETPRVPPIPIDRRVCITPAHGAVECTQRNKDAAGRIDGRRAAAGRRRRFEVRVCAFEVEGRVVEVVVVDVDVGAVARAAPPVRVCVCGGGWGCRASGSVRQSRVGQASAAGQCRAGQGIEDSGREAERVFVSETVSD